MSLVTNRRIAVSFGWAGLAGYISLGLSVVGNFVLARLLVPSEYGTYAVAASIAGFAFLIASWGLPQAIIYLNLPIGELVGSGLFIAAGLVSGVFIVLLGVYLSVGFPEGYQGLLGPVLAIVFARALVMVADILYSPLEKNLQFRVVSTRRSFAQGAGLIIAIIGAGMGASIWSLVYRDVAYALGLLSLLMVGRSLLPAQVRITRDALRNLTSFGMRLWGTRSLEVLNHEGDAGIASLFVSPYSIGIYNRGRFLAELLSFTTTRVISQVAYVSYFALNSERHRQERMFVLFNYLLLHAAVLFSLILILFPGEIVSLVYGAGWDDVQVALLWLAPYGLLLVLFEHLRFFATARGAPGKVIIARVLQFSTFVAVLFSLRTRLGWSALPLSMMAGMAMAYLSLVWQTRSYIVLPRRHYASSIGCAALAGIVALLWRHEVKSGIGEFLGGTLLMTITFSVTSAIMNKREVHNLLKHLGAVVRPATLADRGNKVQY